MPGSPREAKRGLTHRCLLLARWPLARLQFPERVGLFLSFFHRDDRSVPPQFRSLLSIRHKQTMVSTRRSPRVDSSSHTENPESSPLKRKRSPLPAKPKALKRQKPNEPGDEAVVMQGKRAWFLHRGTHNSRLACQ